MMTAAVNCMIANQSRDTNQSLLQRALQTGQGYNCHGCSDEYLNSQVWQEAIQMAISHLYENEMVQNKLDAAFNDLCKSFLVN